MTNKLEKFVEIINEALEYNKKDEDEVTIYEEKLLNEGFDTQDIRLCFKKLINDGIIQKKEVMYAPQITSSTFPPKATLSSSLDWNYKKPVYILKINQKKLEKIEKVTTISKKPVKFLDDEAILQLDNKKCSLPAYKNEHFFCRAIFEYPPNEAIDWSIIYKKMTGKEPEDIEKNQRTVYDTYRTLNERVEKVLEIKELFSWKGKTIKRSQ